MSEDRCDKCRFYLYHGPGSYCLRYPPTVYSDPKDPSRFGSVRPKVLAYTRCGEFQVKNGGRDESRDLRFIADQLKWARLTNLVGFKQHFHLCEAWEVAKRYLDQVPEGDGE